MPKRLGNPQLEHGHTRLANELLEALMRYPFSAGEYRVLLAIVRLTYGWRRRERPIAQRALAQATGVSRRQVKRILADLRQQGVLFRDRTTRPLTYQLNKAYVGWRDWPAQWAGEFCATLQQQGCALSPQGDRVVPVAGDRCVPPLKERKEKEKKEKTFEPAVHNLLASFSQFLNRPLTEEEHALVLRLYELSPAQAQQVLAQVACATQSSSSPTTGGIHDVGTDHSR
jgi:phage replication O-like protein O